MRTFVVPELADTYIANRIRPVGTSDKNNILKASELWFECHGPVDTSQIDANHLEDFQKFLIKKGYDRRHINKLVGFIKSVFTWSARKKLVAHSQACELKLVPALLYSDHIKENPSRVPAKEEDILALLPHLHQQFVDMILFQMLTGSRPSEVCGMKVGEINRDYDGENWIYLPTHHKNKWKGKKRAILLGESEQKVLAKYLDGKPAESPVFCNLLRKKEKPITTASYSRMIAETIKKHKLGKFTPYQLRHSNCTWISRVIDKDHARAQLGHTTTAMTEIYDHSDIDKQKAVIAKRREVGCTFSRYVAGSLAAAAGEPVGAVRPVPTAVPVLRLYRGEGGDRS